MLVPWPGEGWKGHSVDTQTGIESYILSSHMLYFLSRGKAGKHWELAEALRHAGQGEEAEAISE